MLDPSFDLHDHRQTQNMGPLLAKWRRESPVVRLADGQVYVSRMADCWTVLRDPYTFANGNGFKAVEMPDEERMLGEMDPPRHPALRRILRQSFDKHAVESARPFARAEATRLLRDWEDGEPRDLIATFTDRISNLVSFHLVGFPTKDTDRIVTWARELLHSEWTSMNRTERGDGLAGAFPEFAGYLDALVDSHRDRTDAPSFITRLARSRHECLPRVLRPRRPALCPGLRVRRCAGLPRVRARSTRRRPRGTIAFLRDPATRHHGERRRRRSEGRRNE